MKNIIITLSALIVFCFGASAQTLKCGTTQYNQSLRDINPDEYIQQRNQFEQGWAQNPSFIGANAGSTDPGPKYLVSGVTAFLEPRFPVICA